MSGKVKVKSKKKVVKISMSGMPHLKKISLNLLFIILLNLP